MLRNGSDKLSYLTGNIFAQHIDKMRLKIKNIKEYLVAFLIQKIKIQ
jgi:hypothetical protein